MTTATGRESVLRLTSAIEDLGRLYPWLDQAAAEAQAPADVLPRMHVALEEVVANVAFHGFAPGVVGQIVVRLRVEPDAAVLVVEDDGAPFDPTTAPAGEHADTLAETTPGGWGLSLIRHFCPQAVYERRGEQNHLIMRFPLQG